MTGAKRGRWAIKKGMLPERERDGGWKGGNCSSPSSPGPPDDPVKSGSLLPTKWGRGAGKTTGITPSDGGKKES